MEVKLEYMQGILAKQDYLEYDKLLTKMIKAAKSGEQINIINKENECVGELKTYKEMDEFHKRMIQVHGIYGYF